MSGVGRSFSDARVTVDEVEDFVLQFIPTVVGALKHNELEQTSNWIKNACMSGKFAKGAMNVNEACKYDPRAFSSVGAFEVEPHRIVQRMRYVDIGKNTIGYDKYKAMMPRSKRPFAAPATPNVFSVSSKRDWENEAKNWRRFLHEMDPPFDDQSIHNTISDQSRPWQAKRADNKDVYSLLALSSIEPSTIDSPPVPPRIIRDTQSLLEPVGKISGFSNERKRQHEYAFPDPTILMPKVDSENLDGQSFALLYPLLDNERTNRGKLVKSYKFNHDHAPSIESTSPHARPHPVRSKYTQPPASTAMPALLRNTGFPPPRSSLNDPLFLCAKPSLGPATGATSMDDLLYSHIASSI